MLYLQALLQTTSQDDNVFFQPAVIAAIITGLIVIGVNIVTTIIQVRASNRTHTHNQNTLADKKIEEKRKEIYKKLNEFYGPFQQHLGKSLELYRIFRADKPSDFRALTYFLDPNQLYDGRRVELTDNDKAIFNEIVAVGKQIEELILSKAGLIDDPSLRQDMSQVVTEKISTDVTGLQTNGSLALLATHLFVIRLAYEGKLKGQVDIYKNYVFPRTLPPIIESNIARLNSELEELNSIPKT